MKKQENSWVSNNTAENGEEEEDIVCLFFSKLGSYSARFWLF